MELPRIGDDVVELGALRFPAEFAVRLLTRRDAHRWVAGAAPFHLNREVNSGDGADGVEDFLVRIPLPIAEIEDIVAAREDEVQGEQVRCREVGNVDIIAIQVPSGVR